jgi:hypothetical protein
MDRDRDEPDDRAFDRPPPIPSRPPPIPRPSAPDDDEPPSRRPRQNDAWVFFAAAKVISLGIGLVLVIGALAANALSGVLVAGLGCFFAIVARVFQAEEHKRW